MPKLTLTQSKEVEHAELLQFLWITVEWRSVLPRLRREHAAGTTHRAAGSTRRAAATAACIPAGSGHRSEDQSARQARDRPGRRSLRRRRPRCRRHLLRGASREPESPRGKRGTVGHEQFEHDRFQHERPCLERGQLRRDERPHRLLQDAQHGRGGSGHRRAHHRHPARRRRLFLSRRRNAGRHDLKAAFGHGRAQGSRRAHAADVPGDRRPDYFKSYAARKTARHCATATERSPSSSSPSTTTRPMSR